MRRFCRTAPLVLLASLPLALPTAAQAAFPGGNGRIAFSSNRDGDYEIYTMNPDGTGVVQLTNNSVDADRYPAWSADGTKIAFARQFAYMNDPDEFHYTFDIHTMNADGSGVTRLGDPQIYEDVNPTWWRYGSMIAFGSTYSNFPDPSLDYATYRMNANGANFFVIAEPGGGDPAWSPDGEKIAYDNGDIWVTDPFGNVHTQLTSGASLDLHPSWAPFSHRILFNRMGDIFVMNPNGSGQTMLLDESPNSSLTSVFSPDETKIALHSDRSGNSEIFTMNADATALANITNNSASDVDPDWQPTVGYARPKSATPTSVKLVPAFKQCTASNGSHGPPLASPSCNPPVQASDYLTVGTPDANGKTANSSGFIRMRVFSCPMCASPLPPDVFFTAELTDVRNKSDLSDYTGDLQAVLNLRMTDRYNGPSLDYPATVTDTPFSFRLTCMATEATGVGSTCAASTSANAILPGLVRDFQRAVWQLGQVKVYDGGADGDAETADNTLFAVQGLFTP